MRGPNGKSYIHVVIIMYFFHPFLLDMLQKDTFSPQLFSSRNRAWKEFFCILCNDTSVILMTWKLNSKWTVMMFEDLWYVFSYENLITKWCFYQFKCHFDWSFTTLGPPSRNGYESGRLISFSLCVFCQVWGPEVSDCSPGTHQHIQWQDMGNLLVLPSTLFQTAMVSEVMTVFITTYSKRHSSVVDSAFKIVGGDLNLWRVNVNLYPKNIFWYVKGTQFWSPLHQHSVKNIHQVMK